MASVACGEVHTVTPAPCTQPGGGVVEPLPRPPPGVCEQCAQAPLLLLCCLSSRLLSALLWWSWPAGGPARAERDGCWLPDDSPLPARSRDLPLAPPAARGVMTREEEGREGERERGREGEGEKRKAKMGREEARGDGLKTRWRRPKHDVCRQVQVKSASDGSEGEGSGVRERKGLAPRPSLSAQCACSRVASSSKGWSHHNLVFTLLAFVQSLTTVLHLLGGGRWLRWRGGSERRGELRAVGQAEALHDLGSVLACRPDSKHAKRTNPAPAVRASSLCLRAWCGCCALSCREGSCADVQRRDGRRRVGVRDDDVRMQPQRASGELGL